MSDKIIKYIGLNNREIKESKGGKVLVNIRTGYEVPKMSKDLTALMLKKGYIREATEKDILRRYPGVKYA